MSDLGEKSLEKKWKKRHFQKNGIGNEKNNNLITNFYLHIKTRHTVKSCLTTNPNPVTSTSLSNRIPRNAQRAIPEIIQHGRYQLKSVRTNLPAQSPESGKLSGRARKGGEFEGSLWENGRAWTPDYS